MIRLEQRGMLFKVALLLICAVCGALATSYKDGEAVTLYVNKIGPFYNPQETYHYYELPVCRPEKIEHKSLSLAEILNGDRMAISTYKINFLRAAEDQTLCSFELKHDELEHMIEAIEELYYFEFVLDGIPMRGFLGRFEEEGIFPHIHQTYLYTHHKFVIEYNGPHIVLATVIPSHPVLISRTTETDEHSHSHGHAHSHSEKELEGNAKVESAKDAESLKGPGSKVQVTFHYSVEWVKSSVPYEQRESRIKEVQQLAPRSYEIHWLSVVNSTILVVLLIAFIAVILANILKKDFARYNLRDSSSPAKSAAGVTVTSDDDSIEDEYGWKIIYADVFRFPKYKELFCAILGCGTQLIVCVTCVLLLASFNMFNVHYHGRLHVVGVILYALTQGIAGFVAMLTYKQMDGRYWVWTVNLTSALFSGPCFFVWAVNNTIAWWMGATQALPWTTILLFCILFLCVGYPLTVIGGILGKNYAPPFEAPVRTKQIAREIPTLPWYKSTVASCAIGGFLPFSSISVELYYLYATWFGREPYTLYAILCLMFVILLSVCACCGIALTYFQLAAEDHRWWWRSIIQTGSTGWFILAYSVFYYWKRSNMSGLLQSMQFFGTAFVFAYILFILLGTISFFSSLKFVRYIYSNIKMD